MHRCCFCLLKTYILTHPKYLYGTLMLFEQRSENGWWFLTETVSITVTPKTLGCVLWSGSALFCLLKNYFLIHSKYLCGMPMLFDQCSENGWRLLAEPVSIAVTPKKLSQPCNSCLCVVVRFSFSNMDWMLDSCSVNVAMWTSLKGARSNAQY